MNSLGSPCRRLADTHANGKKPCVLSPACASYFPLFTFCFFVCLSHSLSTSLFLFLRRCANGGARLRPKHKGLVAHVMCTCVHTDVYIYLCIPMVVRMRWLCACFWRVFVSVYVWRRTEELSTRASLSPDSLPVSLLPATRVYILHVRACVAWSGGRMLTSSFESS